MKSKLSPDHHHFSWRPVFIKIDIRCNHNNDYTSILSQYTSTGKTKQNKILYIYWYVFLNPCPIVILLLIKLFCCGNVFQCRIGEEISQENHPQSYMQVIYISGKKITKESQIASVTPSKRVLWNAFHLKEQKSFL